jgi:outer membrane protein OmpU
MKKILLATTVLASFAGAASAEVVFSGYGRFGLEYNSEPNKTYFADGTIVQNTNGTNPITGETIYTEKSNSQISDRMRLNIDGKTVTDGGITFGGRIRLQGDSGNTGAQLNAPQLYTEANGFRLEVGNVNEALDSVALFYNSEMGYEDNSAGEGGNFYSYDSNPYSGGILNTENRNGIFFSYAMAGVNARMSYILPDATLQTNKNHTSGEFSASADYAWNGFTVAAGGAAHAGGLSRAFYNFVGVGYVISPDMNVGLNYNNGNYLALAGYANSGSNGTDTATGLNLNSNAVSITTLYGNYTMGAITLRGYITGTNADYVKQDVLVGIGADYNLGGGARLSGSIRPNYAGNTNADVGVRFDF